MKKGTLIVIDGSDGAGKTTQMNLLISRLKKEDKKVRTYHFPHYENFFGKFIGECLVGEYGDFVGLDPHIASVLYAADRFESKKKIEGWLAKGDIVVLDRYVSANQIHQGGKIRDVKKRTKFISWLEIMEHKIFGIPRPDIIFYLHLPTKQSLELMKGRSSKGRSYITRGKKDQHENNIEHLQHAEESALWLSTRQKRWKKIECACPEGILPREVIHEKLWSVVRTRLPR